MSSPEFQSSDDDLFEYDPSKESLQKSSSEIFSSSVSGKNKIFDDISEDLKNNKEAINFFDGMRVKFAEAFVSAYQRTISSLDLSAYFYTVNAVLNDLTDGKFSLFYLHKVTEQTLLKRIAVNHIINSTFMDTESTKDPAFVNFLKGVGVQDVSEYFDLYGGVLMKISSHVLNVERSLYMRICEELNITPNPCVLDSSPTPEEVYKCLISSPSDVHSELLNVEAFKLMDDSFYQKLSGIFGFTQNYIVREV
jgi:hypothetical protein